MAGRASKDAFKELRRYFRRNGYLRSFDPERRASEGTSYKKGYEVRLVANNAAELAHIRRLLRAAGFSVGRPFAMRNQFRQPVYGREQVERFLAGIGERR